MTLLTIAGFDPSSGAGITADLAVFAAHGFFGVSAITGLTVQSTTGVRRVQAVSPLLLRDTLACLAQDIQLTGIKIGMLATAANVAVVADFLEILPTVPVVLDPVLRSSSGAALLDPEGIGLLRKRLLPGVSWVTPNRAEALLLGKIPAGIDAVITGGDDDAADLVMAGGTETWLRGERIESRATHGTGCAFSSALLCGLAAGLDGVEAARRAKQYVAEAIRKAPAVGRGHGPMALDWPLRQWNKPDHPPPELVRS